MSPARRVPNGIRRYWCQRGCGKRVVWKNQNPYARGGDRFQCVVCGWAVPDRATLLRFQHGEASS
jgi:hypothetical protein